MNLILPAEHVGNARIVDGHLDVGGLRVPVDGFIGDDVPVFVRRMSRDLSVAHILIARTDRYAQEELDAQNQEAGRYPLGAKAYWRGQMPGMTDEEFDDWFDG